MKVPPRAITLLAAALAAAGPVLAQNPPRPNPAPARPAPVVQQAPAPAPAQQRPVLDSAAVRAVAAAAARAAAESLAARVDSAQQAIEQLRAQLEEQAQAKVQSRLRNPVEISGLVLFNAFGTNARVNNADVPLWVEADQDTTGLPNSYIGAAVRQTRLGVAVSGVRVIGAQLGADLQTDFYGGSIGGPLNPVLRVRTATVRLDWPHFGLLVGQDKPLVSPVNPLSYASSGFPGFASAGNLWAWIPQARLTLEAGRRFRVGLQGAALAPQVAKDYDAFGAQFGDSATVASKSRRPNVEGRLYADWGDGDLESQLGVGVHYGWVATKGDTLLVSKAFTVDGRIAIGEHILILGEGFFQGQALGGLGGGIDQNWGAGGVPVRTQGGFGQLTIRPTWAWEIGGGYGMDDPNDDDLDPTFQRGKNVVIEGHLHWKPGGGLLLGAEYRRIETTYAAGSIAASHVNVFAGVAF